MSESTLGSKFWAMGKSTFELDITHDQTIRPHQTN